MHQSKVSTIGLALNGNWRDLIVGDLNSYDADAEKGSSLSLCNPATNPQGTITDLDTAEPTGARFEIGLIARFKLMRFVPEVSPGDANQDEVVNFLAIAPLIAILSCAGYLVEPDNDEDGAVCCLDIGPFVALLSS